MIDADDEDLVVLPESFAGGEVEIQRGDLARILFERTAADVELEMCVFTADGGVPARRDHDGQRRFVAERYAGMAGQAPELVGALKTAPHFYDGDRETAFADCEREIKKSTDCQQIAGGVGGMFAPKTQGAIKRRTIVYKILTRGVFLRLLD